MIWHLTFSSEGRHPLFPTAAHRRSAVGCIAAIGTEVILFCVVDDHLHVVIVADTDRAGRIAAGLLLSLRPVAATTLLPAYVRPVTTRRHLEWLADEYILSQPKEHGLAEHPALYEGSCFQDLVGARVLDGISTSLPARLLSALPRYKLRRAYRAVGLEETPLELLADDRIRALGAARIAAAVETVVGAAPGMVGNGAIECLARRATVHVVRQVGISTKECIFVLGIDRSSVSRLAARTVPDIVLDAVRLRLALEVRVAG